MSNEEQKDIRSHRERLPLVDKETQRKKALAKDRQSKEDLNTTFSTPEGKRTLKFIKDLCGFGVSNIGANTAMGMDIKDGTFHNAARQSIYLELRNYISTQILKDVEFNDKIINEEIV